MKVLLFESFSNNNVSAMVDELDSEISSSNMRVGPTIDKLPWAMEAVVFEFIKDRALEANASGQVNIDSIIDQVEQHKDDLKKQAMNKLMGAGMGEQEIEDTFKIGYKVRNLKHETLTARPIQQQIENEISDTNDQATVEPPIDDQEKQFRSARNRGRNIMRKHLDAANYRKPVQKKVKPKLTVRPISHDTV